jgi:hypothetical protein
VKVWRAGRRRTWRIGPKPMAGLDVAVVGSLMERQRGRVSGERVGWISVEVYVVYTMN